MGRKVTNVMCLGLREDLEVTVSSGRCSLCQSMGSFNSATKIPESDDPDADLDFSDVKTKEGLLERCGDELVSLPPPFERKWRDVSCSNKQEGVGRFRIMQWNLLSQAIGEKHDKFVACPEDALSWTTRRFRMLEEIVQHSPDIACLQEVDHFRFLENSLKQLGYTGVFLPKPDSPCYYIEGNTGPDGCAIFYKTDKFELIKKQTRILEVCRVQSNQVLIFLILKEIETNKEVCVATTHLKARSGALLSLLRNEQGKDLLGFISLHHAGRPLVICGDFNADPVEPVYARMTSHSELELTSSYTYMSNKREEPAYTTWKIREEGEICHTLDYIFHTDHNLKVESLLEMPTEEQIGPGRIPSYQYASDHFSICADFSFVQNTG